MKNCLEETILVKTPKYILLAHNLYNIKLYICYLFRFTVSLLLYLRMILHQSQNYHYLLVV